MGHSTIKLILGTHSPNCLRMKRNILYYPTINIPSADWLRNAVLYWDEVSSIVPRFSPDENSFRLSDDIHYLTQENQFRSIHPDTLFEDYDLSSQFSEEIKAVIDSPQFNLILTQSKRRMSSIHRSKGGEAIHSKGSAHIHRDKGNHDLFHYLEKKNLTVRDRANPEWYYIEAHTGLLYMSILAKYLAEKDEEQTVVGTDLRAYERINFKPLSVLGKTSVMSFDLKGLIPSPASNVSFRQIVEFKRKRKAHLAAFRKQIFTRQKEFAAAKSQAEIKELMASFQEELTESMTELGRVLKDEKIGFFLKSFKSLINYESPKAWAAGAALIDSHYHLSGIPDWMKVTAFAAFSGIEIATHYIDANRERNTANKSPFAYLYYGRRAGIIQ